MGQAALPAGLLAFISQGGQQLQAPALQDASIWAKMGAKRRKEQDALKAEEAAQAAEMERLQNVWGDYQTEDPYMLQAKKAALSGDEETALGMLKSGYDQSIKPDRAETAVGLFNRDEDAHGRYAAAGRPQTTVNTYGNQLRTIDQQVELDDRLAVAKGDREYVGGIVASEDKTRNSLNRVDETLRLMDNPDVYTGMFSDQVLDAKKFGNLLGGDFAGVAGTEALRQKMGDFVMARVAETKGAVSEREMQLFKEYSANMNNTPEANRIILGYVKDKLKRDAMISRETFRLRDSGARDSQIRKRIRELRNENPLSIEKEASTWRKNMPDSRTRGQGNTGTIEARIPAEWDADKRARFEAYSKSKDR